MLSEAAQHQCIYDEQVIEPGFGYIKTRDGTTLSVYVTLPGPIVSGANRFDQNKNDPSARRRPEDPTEHRATNTTLANAPGHHARDQFAREEGQHRSTTAHGHEACQRGFTEHQQQGQ